MTNNIKYKSYISGNIIIISDSVYEIQADNTLKSISIPK